MTEQTLPEVAHFTDRKKRRWNLHVTIPLATVIRTELGVNILDTKGGFAQLSADPILLCGVLWMICEKQAERAEVTPEQFGELLHGETLGDATEAFVEAVTNFSPPRQREILQATQAAGNSLLDLMAGMAKQEIPQTIQKLRDLMCGNSLPDGPESSDTNPPEPSGN